MELSASFASFESFASVAGTFSLACSSGCVSTKKSCYGLSLEEGD